MIVDYIPNGNQNRPGGKNSMEYITLHDTGNPAKTATARSHAKYLKNPNTNVSWHYTVDENEVVCHLPDEETAWHTGDKIGNASSIGIEVCINGDLTRAYDRAAILCAELCRKHGLSPAAVVQHNHWNGKDCPKTMRQGSPYSFETFRKKVEAALSAPSDWAKEAWDEAISRGITDGTNPHAPATREEVVTMILRAMKTEE